MRIKHVVPLLMSIALAGCAATPAPRSYEDALNSTAARQPLPAGTAEELRYRVGFVFANRARMEIPTAWRVRNPDTMNSPAYDALSIQVSATNFAAGNVAAGSLDVLTWLNAGLSKEARWGHYVRETAPLVALPNTQYYRFTLGTGVASEADVEEAWDAAHRLLETIYGSDCSVLGWTPELGYAATHMKFVPGSYRESVFVCRHPVVPGESIRVNVSAFANPAAGLRSVAMVQGQCWVARPPSQWLDITPCGLERADREAGLVPTEPEGKWMQLVTTPAADDAGKMITIARYEGRELVLEPPALNAEYAAFLRSRKADALAQRSAAVTDGVVR